MRWRETIVAAGLCLSVFGCGGGGGGTASSGPPPADPRQVRLNQPVEYAPARPNAGFPQPEGVLLQYLALGSETAMRSHAWALWASLTAPTASGVPTMLTWYGNSEIFGAGTVADQRVFLPQLLVGRRDTFGDGNPPTEANYYNQPYRDHVRAHGYQWRQTLLDLVGVIPDVVDFPESTLVAKTVWWPVRHDGLTALPVWDAQPTRPIEWGLGVNALVDQGAFGPLTPEEQEELRTHETHGNDWGTFRRVVAVDPTSAAPAGTVAQVEFFDPDVLDYSGSETRTADVVPLSSFFTVRLTDAATVQRLNDGQMGQISERFWGRPLTQEDSLALVAVHVTTRETPDWVWATFWWHDQPDPDRPPNLPGPFGQFRMAVAQSADIPTASDGGPHIAYNPYLEAGFSLGTRSNCLGCHQRAGWTDQGFSDPMPVHRGTLAKDDPVFQGVLRTHFLWSLAFRPRPHIP